MERVRMKEVRAVTFLLMMEITFKSESNESEFKLRPLKEMSLKI